VVLGLDAQSLLCLLVLPLYVRLQLCPLDPPLTTPAELDSPNVTAASMETTCTSLLARTSATCGTVRKRPASGWGTEHRLGLSGHHPRTG
jgi:hypothetical protein